MVHCSALLILSSAQRVCCRTLGTKTAPQRNTLKQTALGMIRQCCVCSSYVPTPTTFLHTLDARVKQLWLVALYFLVARATPEVRRMTTSGALSSHANNVCDDNSSI
jgi:hypothetical protein